MVISHIGEEQAMNNLPKVILDTDIGDDIDDSFALLLLLESHRFNCLGVTTVFRNAYKRAKMAKQLISKLGYDVKVYAGIDMPLKQKIEHLIPEDIKKKEKVDEDGKYLFPQYDKSMDDEIVEKENAVDFIIDMVHRYPHEVTLIPIGPLTNIAIAIKKDPSIIPLIKEVRLMGAGLNLNFVEWNIFCDPDAAKLVFSSNINKIVAVTLNVTMQTSLSDKEVDSLKHNNSAAIKLVYEAMMKWFKHYEFTSPVMHDPLTVASLIDETIIGTQLCHLDVDLTKDGYTYINDNCHNNVYVSTSLNKEKFFKLFKEILAI